MRSLGWLVLLVALLLPQLSSAKAPPPEKIAVAIGKWEGPSASTFKAGCRKGLGKDVKVVPEKKARVVVGGQVAAQGKGFVVSVIVKSPKTGEVVEQRDFNFAKAKVSGAQSKKMGKAVVDIARRAPEPDAAQ